MRKKETIRERINRLWCDHMDGGCYDDFCAMVDALTEEEMCEVCKMFDENTRDCDIEGAFEYVDDIADWLEIDADELYQRTL